MQYYCLILTRTFHSARPPDMLSWWCFTTAVTASLYLAARQLRILQYVLMNKYNSDSET